MSLAPGARPTFFSSHNLTTQLQISIAFLSSSIHPVVTPSRVMYVLYGVFIILKPRSDSDMPRTSPEQWVLILILVLCSVCSLGS